MFEIFAQSLVLNSFYYTDRHSQEWLPSIKFFSWWNLFIFLVSELLEVTPDELGSALTADYTVARGKFVLCQPEIHL